MSDSGEGLIDADSRIQERMEELESEKRQRSQRDARDPEQVRAIESLRLARKELERQFEATTHDARRSQITQALEELDRRIAVASQGVVNTKTAASPAR
jgi:hypothetical protein